MIQVSTWAGLEKSFQACYSVRFSRFPEKPPSKCLTSKSKKTSRSTSPCAASSVPSKKSVSYEKPTAERKRKLAAAVKRQSKRLRGQQLPPKMY